MKHDFSGYGIPVAFMVTNSETKWPLARWLSWLREIYLIPVSPKFMTNCSVIEIAAIISSFESPQFRSYHRCMSRSMWSQVNAKIKTSASNEEKSLMQIKKSAAQDFMGLIYSKTIEEFGQIWTNLE